jgi:putative transcriptional regulator
MIKHHVPDDMLKQFAEGVLPASLSAAVAIHIDMCDGCAEKVQQWQHKLALDAFDGDDMDLQLVANDLDMADMMASITEDMEQDTWHKPQPVVVSLGPAQYQLHRALQSMPVDRSVSFGKIARAKIELGEGEVHSHLLHMSPGAEVFKHTHTGFEMTLILQGSFADEMGKYVAGDFILLNDQHTHTPKSVEGCLCLTVVSDALKFTSGWSRLLNPIGKHLY